jgi:hypothetical protein
MGVRIICTIILFDSFVELLVSGRVPILCPIVLAIDGLLLGRLGIESRFFNIVISYASVNIQTFKAFYPMSYVLLGRLSVESRFFNIVTSYIGADIQTFLEHFISLFMSYILQVRFWYQC